MGSWGAGTLDNDDGADWLQDLEDEPDLDEVRVALAAAIDASSEDLEVDTGNVAIAASELVAQLAGSAGARAAVRRGAFTRLTKAFERETLTRRIWFLDRALAATRRIYSDEDSELRQLWDEAAGKKKQTDWHRAVKALEGRLVEAQERLIAPGRAKRPPGVPAKAVYDPKDREWVLAPRDAKGKKHGDVVWWRLDGTMVCRSLHVHGLSHGPFARYHESGEVSQEGTYVDDKIDGVVTHGRSKKPTSELWFDDLSKEVVRGEMVYTAGCWTMLRYLDRRGRRVTHTGNLYPPPPTDVPEGAYYDEQTKEWFAGICDEQSRRHGTWRFWNEKGAPTLEIDYKHGTEVAQRKKPSPRRKRS